MTIYIALLRGINVGGKNRIKMCDLKELFQKIGLRGVSTYIQSGNVLFECSDEEEVLVKRLESEIRIAFGIETNVILRTSKELENIIRNLPFSEEEVSSAEENSKVESLYVSLMSSIPSKEEIQLMENYANDNDKYQVIGRDIYLLFNNSIRNSKLANKLQKLKVPSTVRNWKTINRLVELAKAMESQY